MASEPKVERPRPELSAAKRALIEAMLKGQVRSSGIVPRAKRDGAPLSFAQERLWFIDRLEPGSATYNVPRAWHLGGALDVGALERALGEVVRRHDALRTTFREVDGSPVQVIAPFGGFTLPVEDLSGLGEAEGRAEVRRRAADEAMRPFDLAAGPLVRAALLRLGAENHVLLLSMHHIVSDGWSMGVLYREVSALYTAYREGRESPLPELAVQYADYAVWQREQLAGAALERQLSYWRERLGGAPELLELPADRPRPPVQTFRGASVPVELAPELVERLDALGRSEGATPYMTLLGAFQVLLSKYGGGDDIVVGSDIAGRTRREVEELIGFFVNTLVLRTDLSGDPSFREVLRRVREATVGAYEHQEVPFEKLVAELQPERSLSYSPLVQVMFTLQNAAGGREDGLAGLQVRGAGAAMEIAKFDLSLDLVATPRGVRGELNYSTDLFDRGTVERMLGHLERVLEQVAADPEVRLSRLALAGPEERARVVVEWNRTEAEYLRDASIHQLFEAQAGRTPNAVAVAWGAEELTYRELDARANRLAHHLAGLGVGPESRVGLRLERSVENVVATLAVLKAGGCCVPVDTSYPAERMELMLADSGARVLLGREEIDVPGLHVVRLDQMAEGLAAGPDHPPPANASAQNLAYVFYTSGSTGRPKGVMMAHREVVQLACAIEYMRMEPGDRVAQASNVSFDAAVFEIWGALLNGATLVGIDPDVLLSAPALGRVLREQRITTLYQTAALFDQHVREQVDVYASLRQLVFGAEAVGTESVRQMLRSGRPGLVLHEYGPTEATVWCTLEEVREVAEDAPTVLIGRPIPNARAYVLDAAGEPLPVGVPGELCIGGAGVVRGYLGRPGLTAERFVPDPFAAEPGGRMYRTGDRARWKAEGKLEFMGRLDDQVKIRGFRIEPGEVEAAIAAYPGVRHVRVMMREDQPGDKRLVAYVVGDAEPEALRAHARQSLPEYMVPAAFVALEQLPLNANGKVDRKALPAPEGSSYARAGYEAPLGEVEAALAEIWAEVLGVDRVGRWDHFFELGGHSLLAIRLIERMRRVGLYMEVRALFTTPVLAELALAVGGASLDMEIPANAIPDGCVSITPGMLPLVELSQAEIDRVVAGVPGGAANVQDIYPLAALQEGILFHHLLSREGDPYLLSSLTVFDARARLDQYLAALQAVIDRHDILRTALAWEGLREPVQVVWRQAPLPVDEVQLDAEAGDAPRQLWGRYDPRHYRMDLTRAPLLRACIAEDRTSGRWLLLLLWHHVAEDHESLEVLREEIAAHLRGQESELPAPLPFRNYVARARLGVSREEHERFFRAMLKDVEEPTAPYGMLDVWGEGLGIEEAWLPVASELGARLRRRARALGVGAASLCHLAWAQVLARLSGRNDVVFGTVLFGRMQGGEGTDRVMGPMINTLPVRIGVAEEGAAAAVRRTHALLADLLRHEHASLALAQRCSGVAAPAPLFTSLLNYRHGALPKRSLEGQAAQATEGIRRIGAQERTNYPVVLAVDDLGEEFSLTAQVAAPAEAERVCRMMHTALERLVQALELAPGRAIGSLDVLPEAERRTVVEEWNRTDGEYPADSPIHELFDEQAERTPDAVAVRFEDESLSYAELNARANRLANHLRRRGIGPETRVGICLERSPELVVSLLAVLKAGGAYVPLDPAYPAERLSFMLADSNAPLLLTRLPLPAGLPPHIAEVVCLEADRERIEAESAQAPAASVRPGQLAYVIYTSGSTGTPKGVMVPHRGVPNLAYAQARRFGIDGSSRVLQFASFSFDAAVAEVFDALLAGAILVMAPREALLPGEGLLETLRRGRVTVATLPPSVLAILPPDDLPELRTVVSAGEAVDAATVERWSDGRTFVNAYGPTEVTVCATSAHCEANGRAPAIGRPLENVRVYVLDAGGRPAPIGVAGELYVGGVGVARGYLGRPGLTAEKFVPDPFGRDAGARLYRTGDRVRWTRGELEFLGRVDEQVKVRGFRIEPGEIEAVLRRSGGVADCVVVVREDVPGEKRLVAYVVGGMEAGAAREHLLRELPEYMVPSAFVFLDALPLTPNGKLDRKALPAPDFTPAEERYVAPRTPVEEVLAEIWAEVLRLERVGVEDSFFELGGHSLLATRVVSRVRDVFAVELPLRALFEGPTVAELAVRVEVMRRAEAPVLPPVVPVERTGALPLSFAQERLWFIDRLQPGSTLYNMPAALRLVGALDEAALERSLGEIVRRHEALRTVFREVGDSPVQVIAPFAGFALPVEDLSALGEADREAAARARADEEALQPFDLAAGPLFRALLLRLGAEDHVLLLSMHHIVSDGWSMGVLYRELSSLYGAYREGRGSPLPELPVQYADYAVWQREQLAGGVLERQLTYWRERLAGAPELLELPTDRPRPPLQTYRGATIPVELSLELLERLQALGRSEGATLYMTLLGAFQVLLGKYAGSDDVVVGSPLAGRTRGEVEDLIGFFINTLVLRTDLSADPSFRETLRRVREATLGAYAHQEVPFEKLVAELQPERSMSHSPLFQVVFTLNTAEGRADALPGLEVGAVGAALEMAKFDLSLTLLATPRGLRGTLNYTTDLFDRGTAERMVGHLARVLEQVAADADVRLSRLELLDEADRALVLEAWNRTERPYPRGVCIHELFEAQVRERPGAVALVWGDESLTYAELDARSNQLAHHLVRLGVGPDARVGVLLERSAELIVSILAVLKAGGAYVPLDPGYPPERLRLMLADSSVRVLLSRGGLSAAVAGGGLDVVHLDQAALASESIDAPRGGATAENLAYIVYTSGSTGKPKGVMVAHRHVVQLVVETDYVRFGPGDRIAQASNASFDALTFEAWGAFLNGATLVGIPRDVLLSPPTFREMLREERITTLYQTTALLNQLSREQPDVFSPLREVLFGGQAVDADSVRRLLKAGGPERLLHMYGPTETTAWCSWEQVAHVAEDALTVSVGRPTGNQRIYLLDAALNPVPVGVPGEAYVGGDGVVRGYLDRPGLTAERFVADPFAAEAGTRMYRTGDRLRWKANGRLEFIGRVDEQVKVRGFRIEPGEIEAVLSAHAEVREARVIVSDDASGEKRLVAYVVGSVDADGLRAHLRQSLPEYMVPAAFVALERIPLTPNGKLDVRALPAPELGAAEDPSATPSTPVEEVLAGIWAEVLRLDRVGVKENFFEVGGHSLLATRVVSRIREVFGVEVPLRALFEGPTVAELARWVEEMRRAELPVLPPVVPVERTRALPLSFAQERLWFIDRLEPGSATYHVPVAWRLGGALDEAALERSLGEIVRRHEVLRTVFAEVDGLPVQVIAPFRAFALPVEDLSALGEADREAAVARRAGEEAARPFDLAAGPLFRATLLRLGDEDHVLLVSMHHIVSDGWSMGVLVRELSALYAAYRDGRESPLPELAVQYADYAVWQRQQLAGAVLDRQLAYWKEHLAGAPGLLELPTDHPRPAVQTFRGATVPVELSPELLERVRALGRGEGATLYMTLLAAFQVLLGRYAGSDDVVVGSPIAGRTREEVEALIGFFVNTLVLRTDLSGDPSFRGVLRQVREATLGAYEHQEVPFEKLVAELQPERSLSHSPLFQVMFTVQNAGNVAGGSALPGLRVGGVDAELESAKFDLSLALTATAQGLHGALNYSTDLFERGTVVRMLGHLERVLEQVVGDADVQLSRLELLGDGERALVLEEWNRTEAQYPAERCIHELFEEQAARTPGAVAVRFRDVSLTYGEL
ncbi:amino acid adenylation domain-containing protein, partial [Longimicrobium sp.]|uniref:non-ribosomal peptide synthetase n=1 Tax=Longimicrobium sp. TaxID=2029185 RepID=UPI002F94AA96